MVRTLELAISKAAELPEAAQEQPGREILERLDALAELRAEPGIGVRELAEGLGEPLDIENLIAQARKEHAAGQARRLGAASEARLARNLAVLRTCRLT